MKVASPVTARWGLLRSMVACAAVACLGACGGGGSDTASIPNADADGNRATAMAATVYQVTTKDAFAYASYYERTNVCDEFVVEVFANESSVRREGTVSSQAWVRAQLTKYDHCTEAWTFMSGYTDTPDIRIRHDLTQGTAVATVVRLDGSGAEKTLAVELAWNGGELTTDRFWWNYVTPLSRFMVKSDSRMRRSETVTGALLLDGNDLLAADRPTWARSIQGFVAGSGGLSIDITRTPRSP